MLEYGSSSQVVSEEEADTKLDQPEAGGAVRWNRRVAGLSNSPATGAGGRPAWEGPEAGEEDLGSHWRSWRRRQVGRWPVEDERWPTGLLDFLDSRRTWTVGGCPGALAGIQGYSRQSMLLVVELGSRTSNLEARFAKTEAGKPSERRTTLQEFSGSCRITAGRGVVWWLAATVEGSGGCWRPRGCPKDRGAAGQPPGRAVSSPAGRTRGRRLLVVHPGG